MAARTPGTTRVRRPEPPARPDALNHPHCEKIFVLGGASCTKTQKGAALGGAAGAAGGYIIGNEIDHDKRQEGALIGAGVGAIGGALAGDAMDERNRRHNRHY